MDFSKWRKIFYIVAIISMLLTIKTKVFGAFDYMDTIKTLQNGDTSIDMVASYDNINFKIPSWVYDYDNILITMNSTPSACIGYIIVSNNKIYIDNSNGSIGVESGTYYISGINYRSNSDYSNKTKNDFATGNYNSKQIRWSNQIGSGANGCIAFKGLLYNYSTDEIYADSTPFIYPHFDNVTEINSGYPDGVYISRGDYSSSDDLYFHLLQINYSVPNSDTTLYYYNDHMFALNENSKYYRQYDADINNQYSYYFISRADLSLDTNSSYLYVLSDNSSAIQNSFGLLTTDEENGYFDVISSDTTGVISEAEAQTDKLKKIEQGLVEQANTTNSIQNSLTNTDPDNSTGDNIDTSLSFNNQNETLTNMNMGFFSNLTTLLSSLLDYDLSVIDEITIPLPFYINTDINGDMIKGLKLQSNLMSSHLSVAHGNTVFDLSIIFNAFWLYIFGFYLWRFINKIYIAISTGNILDTFSSSHEAITNDML